LLNNSDSLEKLVGVRCLTAVQNASRRWRPIRCRSLALAKCLNHLFWRQTLQAATEIDGSWSEENFLNGCPIILGAGVVIAKMQQRPIGGGATARYA